MSPSPVSFRHLERMTDDTGLLEHCLGRIPRRKEGYTTDDNARALWACVAWLDHVFSAEDGEFLKDKLMKLIDRYLAFLLWVQQEDGTFHNNIGYNRIPEPEQPSDDCHGRTLWAAALASIKLPDRERQTAAREIILKGMDPVKSMAFPRGWAHVLAACSVLLQHAEESVNQTDPFCRLLAVSMPDYVELFESRLLTQYQTHADVGWRWFEPVMTYGNGVLPWALFHAYQVTGRQETIDIARESLDFLIEKMTNGSGIIRPIGNEGWCTRDHRSDWDQQPLEVMKLALASAQAYQVLGDRSYLEVVEKCRSWFYGENDLGVPMVDVHEGSCYDGLGREGPNLNQGAESTLSYLLTEVIYRNAGLEVDVYDSYSCVPGV